MNINNIIDIIKKTLIFRFTVFSIIYIGVLILISPIIDNLFTTLEDDINKKENKYEIFGEIIFQLVLVSIIWFYLHSFLKKFVENKLNIKIKSATENTINFISSIALIGLQKNLIDKLEYITDFHPFV